MKYVQPYDQPGTPNAPYVNGDPALGIAGSIPPAAAIEHPQREILNVITGAGFTPDEADLSQLFKAIKKLAFSGQGQATYTTPGVVNFTVPADVYFVEAEVWGGGGGGGSNNLTTRGAGGGGGGGYSKKLCAVTPGQVIAVTVGVGGNAGAGGGNGGGGGVSSFGSFCSAAGGPYGLGVGDVSNVGGAGSGGDVNNTGSAGKIGFSIGSAGVGGAGGPAPNSGGAGADSSAAGYQSSGYGAGGGGAGGSPTGNAGAAGRAGAVRLRY